MHRIDHPTADVTNPLVPIFTEGNPGLGVPATIVTDDWLNDVQENIMRVITEGGVTPTKGDAADLFDALEALYGGSGSQGNYADAEILSANRTLTAADAGKFFHLNANNLTINLPNPNSVPLGTRYVLSQISNTGGVVSTPAGTIWNAGSNVGQTSWNLTNKADFELVAASSTQWIMMPRNGAASLATNGYQQLPSGLIVQWGTNTFVAAGSAISFPITFPNNLYGIVLGVNGGSSVNFFAAYGGGSTSGFTGYMSSGASTQVSWMAIGR